MIEYVLVDRPWLAGLRDCILEAAALPPTEGAHLLNAIALYIGILMNQTDPTERELAARAPLMLMPVRRRKSA